MIALPPREVRDDETSVLRRCLIALNRLPGVRAVRNNNGKSPCACKVCAVKLCTSCRSRIMRPITFGLGDGSPDLQCRIEIGGPVNPLPVVFWIEVKAPGHRTSRERAELQSRFRMEAASRGELSAVVENETAAIEAAERFRAEYTRRLTVLG